MKKKIEIKRITALALAAVISVQIFSGCSSSGNNSDDGEEDKVPIKAASVAFSENGDYKTTVTSSEIDLSDLKAEDISITYDFIDDDAYNKSVENAEKEYEEKLLALAEEKDEIGEEDIPKMETVRLGDYMGERNAKVNNVKAEKDKLELSFSDPSASQNLTGYYNLYLKGKKYNDADVVADIGIDYKDYELTPNIKSVLSNAEETRLTLTLNDGSFADKVTKDDITLSGSFEDMRIDSMSCSGKNLTLQLVGKPIKPYGLTTYVDGCVTVAPRAVKGAGSELKAYVPIKLIGKSLDASTIKANGGSITAELELIGTAMPLEDLKPDDFKFEKDVTVTGVKKVGDTRVELTMTVNGAKDASSAAAVINNQKLKISDSEEITVSAAEAYFYPVFDGIEESGDKLKFTIIAYANNGTFAQDIKPEQITLDDGFKKGSVDVVERQNATTAKIILSIPANGQNSESLNVDGKISLKAGTMLSQWGEPTTEDFSYTRNYSQESLGREFSIFNKSPFGGAVVSTEFTRAANGIFDEVGMNLITKSGDPLGRLAYLHVAVGQLLEREVQRIQQEAAGAAQSAAATAGATIARIEGELSALRNSVNISMRQLFQQQAVGLAVGVAGLGLMTWSYLNEVGLCGENKEMVDVFKKTEQRTEQLKESVENEYHRLSSLKAAALGTIVTECDVRLSDLNQYTEVCSGYFDDGHLEDLDLEQPENILPNERTTQFAYDLSVALANANRRQDAGYENYQKDFERLQEDFELVCNLLLIKDGGDPLTALDSAYANIDNFSTSSYMLKQAYRSNIKESLDKAIQLIRAYKLASYKFTKNSDGTLASRTNADGQKIYLINQDTVDLTDEELYAKVVERLSEDNTYMFKTEESELTEAEKEIKDQINKMVAASNTEANYVEGLLDKYIPNNGVRRQWNNPSIDADVRYVNKKFTVKNALNSICKKYPEVNEIIDRYISYCKPVIESVDTSKYSNSLFANMQSCAQLENVVSYNPGGTLTYTDGSNHANYKHWGTATCEPIATRVDLQYPDALDEYEFFSFAVQARAEDAKDGVQKKIKPYCYSLETYVTSVDNCWENDYQFRAYTNYTSLQINEFFSRLKDSGRTLIEELTNAGVNISEKYANATNVKGKGSENSDSSNLYGLALYHNTYSKYDGWKVKYSWNTFTNLYYWDAKDKDDVTPYRIMVWRGLSGECRNRVAILIP